MKKKQGLNFIVPLVVYPFDVMVSINETDDQLHKTLSKYLSDDETTWKWNNETQLGRCCIFSTNQGLIRLRRNPVSPTDYGNVQHEIFHYVMHVLKRMGMKWTPKSDEAYSYLIQYITQEIYKRI